MARITDFVVFKDQKLARRYEKKAIPMATLYEAYFDGALDIPGDIYALLKSRADFVSWSLTTEHLRWAVTNFIPEVTIHSKDQDKRIVREHYDRGNDFFGWFLGERMVYTSGFFENRGQSLEQAQDNKISSLEMVEHVGVKNLVPFYELVRDLLEDDGLFLLQWTGLRRGLRPEDLIWGLFMNKYVFPGADASLCPSAMLKAMEKAGWETHSVENISIHYGYTIKLWHDNWLSNKEAVVKAYGDRWFRIWHFFLAWSTIVAEQGNAACFQVVLNKNMDAFDRHRWVKKNATILGDRASFAQAAAE